MEEIKKPTDSITPISPASPAQFPPAQEAFPTGNRELRFAVILAVLCVALCNCMLYGGFYGGFGVLCAGCILCSIVYLLRSGKKFSGYTGAVLGLSIVIALSFLRSNDGFVKFVSVCFLLLTVNLGLCLVSGQNLRGTEGISSLLDAPRTLFVLGLGKLGVAFRGIKLAMQQMGAAGKKRNAVLLGLLVAIPILAILIPLLISADAAFEGLLDLLPEIEWGQIIGSVMFGAIFACVWYTRAVALVHQKKQEHIPKLRKGISAITVNTVLGAVGALYVVYLLSQLTYFVGGFAGILPEGFTLADYARRGFFEMAWLSAINLSVMTLSIGLLEKRDGKAPLSTRLLALFIGVVTLFFVATASAKMLLYIDSYGLTRLRVLTEVIMVFLGATTVIVSIWLFQPKLAYMKVILVTALVIAALVAWVDVDTVVASYNVNAYLSGRLDAVDVYYLGSLSYGAAPYIQDLTEASDPGVADSAGKILRDWAISLQDQDIRGWNIAAAIAWDICQEYGTWNP